MDRKERIRNTGISVGLFALDMVEAVTDLGKFEPFTNGYLHDILLPGIGYFIMRVGDINKYLSASIYFGGCSACEIAQGIGAYRGVFDSFDFVAYAVGTGIALGTDTLLSRRKKGIDNILN